MRCWCATAAGRPVGVVIMRVWTSWRRADASASSDSPAEEARQRRRKTSGRLAGRPPG